MSSAHAASACQLTLVRNRLQDLASGFMSGKLLLKLEAVNYLLQHHPAEHFAFLAERGNMRLRWVWTQIAIEL